MTVKGEHLAGFGPLGGDRASVRSVPVPGSRPVRPDGFRVDGTLVAGAPRESLKFDGSGRNRMGANGGAGDEGADAPREKTPLDDWTKRVVTSALPHWAERPAPPPPSDDAALVKESLADPDRFAG